MLCCKCNNLFILLLHLITPMLFGETDTLVNGNVSDRDKDGNKKFLYLIGLEVSCVISSSLIGYYLKLPLILLGDSVIS